MSDKFFGNVDNETTEDTVTIVTAEAVDANEEDTNEGTEPSEVSSVNEEETAVVANPATEPVTLTHTTLGIFRGNDGVFHLARIKYNPFSNDVGPIEVLDESAIDRMSIQEAFKIKVVREGIFIN